jgi:uncharacterized protein (DUF305 family)
MTKLTHIVLTATLTLGLAGCAVAQGMDMAKSPHSADRMAAMQPQSSDAPSTKAFKEVRMKMMQNMEVAYTGNTDVDFVRGMIPHHQGAIDAAKVELAHGKDPAMRSLAESIVADQEKEIAKMNDWLKKNAP